MLGFNRTEIAVYRVLTDAPKTYLRAGQELPAFRVQSLGVEYIQMGHSIFDPRYLDWLLYFRYIERVMCE